MKKIYVYQWFYFASSEPVKDYFHNWQYIVNILHLF